MYFCLWHWLVFENTLKFGGLIQDPSFGDICLIPFPHGGNFFGAARERILVPGKARVCVPLIVNVPRLKIKKGNLNMQRRYWMTHEPRGIFSLVHPLDATVFRPRSANYNIKLTEVALVTKYEQTNHFLPPQGGFHCLGRLTEAFTRTYTTYFFLPIKLMFSPLDG